VLHHSAGCAWRSSRVTTRLAEDARLVLSTEYRMRYGFCAAIDAGETVLLITSMQLALPVPMARPNLCMLTGRQVALRL